MRLPSTKNLQYLVALKDTLHFSKAAEQCFVSQSTLSAGIAKLEQDLNAELVERDNKRVVFTPLGNKVVAQAQTTLVNLQDLVETASVDFLESEISVGAIPTIATYILPNFLAQVSAKFPKVKISFVEDTSDNLLARLANNQIDFAIFAFPYEVPDNIEKYELFNDTLHLVKHQQKIGDQIGQGELLLLEQGHCLRSHIMQGHDISKHQLSDFSCSSVSTLIAMLDMQLGVSFLPKIALDFGVLSPYPNLLASDDSRAHRRVGVIYKKHNPHREDIQQLADILKP